MSQSDLFGDPIKCERKRKRIPTASTRTQSSCESWQHTEEPSLAKFALFAEDVDDLISGLPPYLQPIARHVLDHLDKPVKLPPQTTKDDSLDVMSVVYRLRFHHRASLRVEGDHELQPDYTNSIKDICRLYCEEMLAAKGFRSAAHGISRVTDKNGTRYRVQVWGEAKTKNGGIRTGHIHCGYRDTLEEAYNLQFEWWLKNRGIDLKK